jgi:nucleotide-binding universal stress UspA family protein
MKTILIPMRPRSPERTRSALEAAIRLHQIERAFVYLLSVQPLVSQHVAMYFQPGVLKQTQQEAGLEELQVGRDLLDAAGVPYAALVRVGRSADTIAEVAREFHCDRILLGEEGQPGLAERVFGSLAGQVRNLVTLPAGCEVIGS